MPYTLQYRTGPGKWNNPTFVIRYATLADATRAFLASDPDGLPDVNVRIICNGKPVPRKDYT